MMAARVPFAPCLIAAALAQPLAVHAQSGQATIREARTHGCELRARRRERHDGACGGAGVPGYEVVSWYGWLGPAGTPQPVIQRVNAGMNKTIRAAEVKGRFAANGAEPLVGAPEELGRRISTEIARWRKVVKEAGARVE